MTEKQANAIYDILVEHCGAPPKQYDRDVFVHVHVKEGCREFRCCPVLGFGGKFWSDEWRVNGYKEDQTLESALIEAGTNELLAGLRKKFEENESSFLRRNVD